MSNSASLSAAKRRRGGGPPLGQPPVQGQASAMAMPQGPPPQAGGNLPPGLPPNFRQMPPQLQQQILRQMQQRMMQVQQQQVQQQAQQQASGLPKNIPVAMSSNNMNEKMPPQISGSGPYVVNSVLHNRAISEVDGIHIRDLPMSAAGLPCLPSGAALPPNILFKLHHDELLNQDATINDYSNRLQMLTNRVDKIERGVGGGVGNGSGGSSNSSNTTDQALSNDTNMNGLASNTEFIAKVLDNILTNTNLSDIINQIEPLQKENESLRALIHSQQTTLNELSTLVMKLINGSLPSQIQQNYDGENTCTSTSLATDNFNLKYEDIKDVFCNYVNGNAGEAGEEINNNFEQQQQPGQEEGQEYSQEYVEDEEQVNQEEQGEEGEEGET
jgi:hypothetical protein